MLFWNVKLGQKYGMPSFGFSLGLALKLEPFGLLEILPTEEVPEVI